MKNFSAVWKAAFAALIAVLAACGGGNSDSSPTVAAVPAATKDVVFANVPTNVLQTSVTPGQRKVLLAGTTVQVNSTVTKAGATQLVFENVSTGYKAGTLRGFQMVDAYGNDLKDVAAWYTATVDPKTDKVTIDFASDWNLLGIIQPGQVFWLQAYVATTAADGVTFAYNLTKVQMHQNDVLVDPEVKGGQMVVTRVVSLDSPTVTTASLAKINTSATSPGFLMNTVTLHVSCAPSNTCYFNEVKFASKGLYYIDIVSGNEFVTAYQTNSVASTDPTDLTATPTYLYTASIYPTVVIAAGNTTDIVIRTAAYQQSPASINVVDMTFTVIDATGRSMQVSPRVPSASSGTCVLAIAGLIGC